MSGYLFWDEDCLKNSIDTTLPALSTRSVFDPDLFCEEGNDDILGDILPPLPISPLIPTPSKALELPQPHELRLDDPAFQYLNMSPVPNAQIQTPSEEQISLPVCPNEASPSSIDISPNPGCSHFPQRQWGSLLDENCPLRKRVKVTIIPSGRKRDLSGTKSDPSSLAASPPLKKPRHSQSRVTAPRRLQTTFCVPQPGEKSARLTLQIPSALNKPKVSTPSITPGSTTPGDLSPHFSSGEPSSPIGQTHVKPFCLESNLPVTVPGVPFHKQSYQPPIRPTARPVLQSSAVLSSVLQARLSQLARKRNTVKKPAVQTRSTLPLVDVAVQAVTRAAKAYSDALASVALPVAVGAAASLGVAQPPQAASRVAKKRRGNKRRRVLLSFDDKDVKPLLDDTIPISRESALTRYLNTSSPVKTRAKTS